MSMSAATEQIMFDEMMRVRKHGKYSPHESNYTRLFGTPERAARTVVATNMACTNGECGECPFCGFQKCPEAGDYSALLEWLRGDA